MKWPDNLEIVDRGHGKLTTSISVSRATEMVEWASSNLESGQIERYALVPVSLEDVYVDIVGQKEAEQW